MVDGDRVVIIDLARVRYGDADRDLAQVPFVLTRYGEKARAAFFKWYRPKVPIEWYANDNDLGYDLGIEPRTR